MPPTNFPASVDNFTNPTNTDNLNTPGVTHHVQHNNHNDSITALETKLGVDFSSIVNSIDFITTLLLMSSTEHPKGGFREMTPLGNPFPTNINWYTDNGKTIKLVEKIYTYDTQKRITQVQLKIYDGTTGNNIKRTITDVKSFYANSPFETNCSRVIA